MIDYEEILLGQGSELRANLTADVLCDEILGFEDVDSAAREEAEENLEEQAEGEDQQDD
jgi:hypothetical protein